MAQEGDARDIYAMPMAGERKAAPWNNRFAVAPAGDRFLFAKSVRDEEHGPKIALVRKGSREFEAPR